MNWQGFERQLEELDLMGTPASMTMLRFRMFVTARCVFTEHARVGEAALRRAEAQWAHDKRVRALHARDVRACLEGMGFSAYISGGMRTWRGIGLR